MFYIEYYIKYLQLTDYGDARLMTQIVTLVYLLPIRIGVITYNVFYLYNVI